MAQTNGYDILILAWRTDRMQWEPVSKFRASQGKQKPIVPLLLYKGHYRTIEWQTKWPKEWEHFEGDKGTVRGGAGYSDSESAASSWWFKTRPETVVSARATRGGSQRSTGVPEVEEEKQQPKRTSMKTRKGKLKVMKKETKDKTRVWHCPFCTTSVESDRGGRWMSGTIQNHLRQRHLKETQKRLEENGEFGAGQTGLGLREMMKPIEFSSQVPETQRAFTCPYCKEGIGECSRWQMEMSKRTHLRKCSPGKSLADMYRDARKKQGSTYDMGKWTAAAKEEKSLQAVKDWNKKLGKKGHEIIRVAIQWPLAEGECKQRKGYFQVCNKCRFEPRYLNQQKKKCTKVTGTQLEKPAGCWWWRYTKAGTEEQNRDNKVALVAAWEMTAREVEERDKQARKWAEKNPKSVKRSEDNKKDKEPGKATLNLRGGAAKKKN